jgi:hypothetical protein
MDSEDEMMLFLLQEEENAIANQEEHLTILAALLQMQVSDPRNVAPSCRGWNFERTKSKERQRIEGHACYTPIVLPTMHRLDERDFAINSG